MSRSSKVALVAIQLVVLICAVSGIVVTAPDVIDSIGFDQGQAKRNPAYDGSAPTQDKPRGTSDPAYLPDISDQLNTGDSLKDMHLPDKPCSDDLGPEDGFCGSPNSGLEQQLVQDNDAGLIGPTEGYAAGTPESNRSQEYSELPQFRCYGSPSDGGYAVPEGFRAPDAIVIGPGEEPKELPDWFCEHFEVKFENR